MATKKRSRKSRTSKGIHGTTRTGSMSTGIDRLINQYDAFLKGKRVTLTVATKESNRAFVRKNAADVWNNPKFIKEKN